MDRCYNPERNETQAPEGWQVTPQIIGNAKSKGTRACERYCKERGLQYQLRDPADKALGRRELETLARGVGDAAALLDAAGTTYAKRGLAYMEFDAFEELERDPALLRQPIVRTAAGVAIEPTVAELDRLFGRS